MLGTDKGANIEYWYLNLLSIQQLADITMGVKHESGGAFDAWNLGFISIHYL